MLTTDSNVRRDEAITRIKTKRAFLLNLGIYLAVNTLLVVIWMATRDDGDPFWPIWPIGLWGIGVLGQAWHAYGPGARPISDEAVEREMRRRS